MPKSEITFNLEDILVAATLNQPAKPVAIVIFAHGNNSNHLSPANNFVADALNQNNITTLIPDLLTVEERKTNENVLNIDLLAGRLIRFTEKALEQFAFDDLPIGFFGAETATASVLDAAAFLGEAIKAIVCSGGKPDFAKKIKEVIAPTLLIAGSLDSQAIDLNRKTYDQLSCDRKIEIIDGASHLFEEPGTLNEMTNLAVAWFDLYLCGNKIQQNIR